MREKPTCETCRFWTERPRDDDMERSGECRRCPPVILMVMLPKQDRFYDNSYHGVFPDTDPFGWCGEHAPKAEGGHGGLSLSAAGFSARAINCIDSELNKNATIADVVRLSAADLREFRNLGETTLREIRQKLARLGLKLNGDPDLEAKPCE